ncbi:motility protein A [Dongia soli]|uniref:MotA/TolQ/ExbB proton channel family protein n=1 Tax=Dongia soli TaxID=600628 RepID=A0ABU5E9U5_9PROT|nr:MotA/TolQ/ExbB proton channel family protein [Dongia soli]MDY0882636.1 MotA/TolQ/ExbB proton channel family protein [Dongia soli]
MADTTGNEQQNFTRYSDMPVRIEPQGLSLERSTVFGLGCALALIAVAIYLGGTGMAFLDLPSILMVIIGTLAITAMSYSGSELRLALPIIAQILWRQTRDPNQTSIRLLQLAERTRRRGLLQLQGEIYGLRGDPFLQRAMSMLVDGVPVDEVERNLTFEVHAAAQDYQRAVSMLRRAAEIAPAMGLIGTLIGLVQMLSSLNNPERIGPAMAVALIATFYGAVLANVVFLPLASKLERNASGALLLHQICVLGVQSIGRQENPRRLEMLLNTLLPAHQQIKYFN